MPIQTASLLDAALSGRHPLDILDATVIRFRMIGQHADSVTMARIACLYMQEKLEILMGLRSAWMRGEAQSPSDAMRSTLRG